MDSHYFPTNGLFETLALHSDGRVLAGNIGQGGDLLRLYVDGTVDPSLKTNEVGSQVNAILIQDDGKIVAGGGAIVRVNADGSFDPTFNSSSAGIIILLCMAQQRDGKILAGDNNSQPLKRLNADGTPDATFTAPAVTRATQLFYPIMSIALQQDDKILVGGNFSALNGQMHNGVARLNTNGLVDSSFTPTANGPIMAILVQTNGQIVIGGQFSSVNGQAHTNIARLNADGSVDGTFNIQTDAVRPNSSVNCRVESIVRQVNGKLIFGGNFTSVNGQPRHGIARLNADGSLDNGFSIDVHDEVTGIVLLQDGNFFIAGWFDAIGTNSVGSIARFLNNEAGNSQLSISNSTIQWMRTGSVGDVWRTTFSYSTNGSSWIDLGPGARTQNGWQYSGSALPSGATFRARGVTVSGWGNGSSSYYESIIGPPGITVQPVGTTASAGSTVALTVGAGGDGPLSFSWLKNGVPLVNDARIAGAATRTLTLSPVYIADSGSYSVVVSNALGAVTSTLATVGVIDPYIYSSPADQQANAGTIVLLSVVAGGTPPLFYQWRKDGADLPGVTSSSLVLPGAVSGDSGTYSVIVSNAIGSVTSTPATLFVNYAWVDNWSPGGGGAFQGGYGPIAFQRDDKTVIAGHGTIYNWWGYETKVYVQRCYADGSYDIGFSAAPNSTVGYAWTNTINYVGIDDSDRLIVAGQFASIGGQNRNGIARLLSNGSADSFDVGTNKVSAPLALQPDGKMLVIENGAVVRLNANASQDSSFASATVTGGGVSCIALQRDGSIVLGGGFTSVNGVAHARIARLNSGGILDSNFNIGADNSVNCAVVQPDGAILIGGQFGTVGGQTHQRIARLNANGTLDDTFIAQANGLVNTICLQSDGAILVGGGFTTLDGASRSYMGRLNNDGTLDPPFNVGTDNTVNCMSVDRNGNIVVTGTFGYFGGVPHGWRGRLKQYLQPTQSFSIDGSAITWMRGGPGPEFWRVHFSYSADGVNWADLGEAQPIVGGWQLSGVSQQTGVIRARGYVANGNQSSWFVEQQFLFGPAKVLMSDGQFGFRTNHFGFSIIGTNGEQVVIDASQDLSNWSPVATNVVYPNGVYFGDPGSQIMPMRFYRLRSQ